MPENRLRRLTAPLGLALVLLPNHSLADEPTVVITANRIATPEAELGSATSVLTAQDLETRQTQEVYDILQQVPGLELTNTGGRGGTTAVRLRGFDEQDVKVLIDGIEVADPSATASYYDFTDLTAAGIQRIEVVRGPQSTLYGSDAMGGVINITTKSGHDDPGETVSLEGGSFGTLDGMAALRGVSGPLDYAATVSGLETDGIVAAEPKNGNSQKDPYDNFTATLKLGLTLAPNATITTVFRAVDENHTYPGYSAVTGLPADQILPVNASTTQEYYGRVEGDLKLGPVTNTLGVNVTAIDRDYAGPYPGWYDGKTNAVDYQGIWTIEPAWKLAFGGETREEDYADNTGLTASQRTDGGWAELDGSPLEALVLTAGLRGDRVESGASAITYRLTASYGIPGESGLRLHASWGTGFKAPSLYQEFANEPGVVEGDPKLKPERSRGWDAGIEERAWDGRLVADVTYFSNRITDLIDGFYLPDYTYKYGNVDRATTDGVETSVRATLTPDLDLTGAWTWLEAQDGTGTELLRRPHQTIAGTATWSPVEGVRAFASATWISAETDDDFATYPASVVRLTPYTVLALGASWQATTSLSLHARIENLTDRRYEDVLGYAAMGRAAYAGATVSF
jgi:vitamin B12 transporter